MHPDGSGVRQLTNNTFDDTAPSWSPDGTRIVDEGERAVDGTLPGLFAYAIGSGTATRLTTGARVEMISSWQPVPATPSDQPPLPPATAPVPQGDALLIEV